MSFWPLSAGADSGQTSSTDNERPTVTTTQSDLAALIALPQTELAVAANDFVAAVAPDFVYNHSVRSYVFACAMAQATGMTDYDDQLVSSAASSMMSAQRSSPTATSGSKSMEPTPPPHSCVPAMSTSRG